MKPFQQYILVLTCMIVLADYGTSNATAVIQILDISNQKILVAADSKATTYNARKEPVESTFCKIVKVTDSSFLAVTGLGNSDRFNPFTMFRSGYKKFNDNLKTLRFIEGPVRQVLESEMKRARQESIEVYKKAFGNEVKLTLMLFGFDRGSIFSYNTEFRGETPLKITHIDCPGSACIPNRQIALFAGTAEVLDNYHQQYPPSPSTSFVTWVQNAMATAIKAHPELVGPPIDMILVEPKGATWLQVKKKCRT